MISARPRDKRGEDDEEAAEARPDTGRALVQEAPS
jgi:hypothetical protein